MLVQFSVQNYKSFRDEAKLSLLASGYDKDPLTEANLIAGELTGSVRLLRTAAIYGANAAGKSKLVEAMHVMRLFILRSAASTGQKIPVVPFRLNPDTEQAPSEFELVFLHEGDLFRYGFAATADHVVAEWLFYRPELARPKTKEVEIFYRDGQTFDAVHPRQFKIGARLIKDGMIRPDALLLSVAAQFNEVLAQRVFGWLGRFNIISGLQEEGYEGFTVSKVMHPTGKGAIMGFLREADLGITDVRVRAIEHESDLPGNLPTDLRERLTAALTEKDGLIFGGAKAVHRVYDSSGNRTGVLEFDMEDESSGTQKYFALSGPILETLQQGDVLVIDELESKLHPNLVQKIVGLFHSPVTNPRHAQLIFNTHDSNLMTAERGPAEGPSGLGVSTPLLRRDQIWFVKKDRYGASSLYSLAGFKTDQVRKSDDFREKYLQGRYGAVPYLNEYEEGIGQLVQSNDQLGGTPLAEPVGVL